MKLKLFIAILFVLFAKIDFAQNVKISGTELSYANQELVLLTYSEHITFSENALAKSLVKEDGSYLFEFSTENAISVFMYIGRYKAFLLVEPNRDYKIFLPEFSEKSTSEKLNPYFKDMEITLEILSSKKNELNNIISEFDSTFNAVLNKNFPSIYRQRKYSIIDSIVQLIDTQFINIENKYLNSHKLYKYSSLYYMANQRNSEFIIEKYFSENPVLYHHTEYMNMFNQIFARYLTFYSLTKNGNRIPLDISLTKSVVRLKHTLSNNPNLKNDTLKELIILKGIYDNFYLGNYSQKTLLLIIDSIGATTKVAHHKLIVENIKKNVNCLKIGTKAPEFELYNRNKRKKKLSNFSGKFIYLNFANTENYACQKDFQLLANLYKKHGKTIEIVTIISNGTHEDMTEFLEGKDYDWTFLHCGNQPTVIKDYKIKVYPLYFLVDPYGKLALSPALPPHENFEIQLFKEIKKRD